MSRNFKNSNSLYLESSKLNLRLIECQVDICVCQSWSPCPCPPDSKREEVQARAETEVSEDEEGLADEDGGGEHTGEVEFTDGRRFLLYEDDARLLDDDTSEEDSLLLFGVGLSDLINLGPESGTLSHEMSLFIAVGTFSGPNLLRGFLEDLFWSFLLESPVGLRWVVVGSWRVT